MSYEIKLRTLYALILATLEYLHMAQSKTITYGKLEQLQFIPIQIRNIKI